MFQRLRGVVMGHQHVSTLKDPAPVESQERVENHGKVSFVSGESTGATGVLTSLGSKRGIPPTTRKPILKVKKGIPTGPPEKGTSGKIVVSPQTYASVLQGGAKVRRSRKSETMVSLFKNNPIVRV